LALSCDIAALYSSSCRAFWLPTAESNVLHTLIPSIMMLAMTTGFRPGTDVLSGREVSSAVNLPQLQEAPADWHEPPVPLA
jgi:hypothetical protein